LEIDQKILAPVIFSLLIIVCLLAFLFFGQRSLLFPAPNFRLPDNLPPNIEKIELDAGYGLLLMPEFRLKQKVPLLIYAHGNAEVAIWSADSFAELLQQGIAVLLLEYPGYGGAEGSPGFESIRIAALSAYDEMVKRQEFDAETIMVYGRSIGGGAAALMVSERQVAGLGLESSFSTLASLVAEKGLPSALLLDRFDNIAIVQNLEIPVFLYHGTKDIVIPIHHSELLRNAASNVVFHQAHCGHNDCARPWPLLLTFLEERAGGF